MVVLAHHSLEGLETAGLVGPAVEHWHKLLAPVMMPLFFLVGGLFAKRSIEGPFGKFLDTKILNFLYLYVVWSVISHCFRYLSNSVANNQVNLADLLYIAWDPVLTVWFLYGLVLCFALTRLFRSVDVSIVIAMAASVQAASFVFPPIPYVDIINKLAVLYVYFLIGVYSSKWIFDKAASTNYLKIIAAVVLFFAVGIAANNSGYFYRPVVFILLSGLSIYAVFCFLALNQENVVGRFFAFVGTYSLPIYLMHFLPVPGSRIVMVKLFGVTNPWFLLALAVALGVAFGIVGYLILVKTPLRILFEKPAWLSVRKQDDPQTSRSGELA